MDIKGEIQLIDELELRETITTHPFGNFAEQINRVTIVKYENGPRVDINREKGEVTLFLTGSERTKSNFRYILLHELGHVFDILDPGFLYTTEARKSLSNNQNKLIFVTDLWNTYIDGRLHRKKLFEFSDSPENRLSIFCKKTITLDSIDSYIEEMACRLGSMDLDFEKSRRLIGQVWCSPYGSLTYPFFFEQHDSFY